jgi:drug/metabolite transporter (DMT)-like permease
LLGFGGVALLAAPTLDGGGWWPVTEVLLVAVGYAGAPFIEPCATYPAWRLTGTSLALASLVYAPAAAVTWPAALPSGRALLALAGLAVVCTALAFVLFVALIREIGPGRATVITYVNPAVAVALGVVVLGEPLTPLVGAAFALILFGSVLATRASGPRRRGLPPVEQSQRAATAEV